MKNNINILTREFIHLISNCGLILEYKGTIATLNDMSNQSHVDFLISNEELEKSLDDISEKILLPIAFKLAEHINKRNSKLCYYLTIPDRVNEYDYATHICNGLCVRGILDKNYKMFDEKENEITTNCIRFDIVYS